MRYIDPHIHMVSRTTDDYQRMAYAGCAAVSEPAFWAGFDRRTADLGARIERLTAAETANAESMATMLGEARLERQNLEVARQRLRSLNTLYGPEATREQGFCVHG